MKESFFRIFRKLKELSDRVSFGLRMVVKGLVILTLFPSVLMAQEATVKETWQEILTYPFDDPDPVPVLTGKNRMIYPYHNFDGYSITGQKQKWKVVKLENAYIEVYVLPEVGGKIWGAIEKSTGKEFIYRNEVMKFRNIALRGPWTSGGIEFNFGYIGHTPATATPVDYLTRKNPDGSVSCIVGSIDLPSRTQWRVEIALPKDKAYFETWVTWYNPTPVPQSYYNWMTGSAVVSEDLEFFYPGNYELDHDGSSHPWPIDKEGRDLTKYPNNAFGSHRSSHVVGEYTNFMGGYYHYSAFGFGHQALYDEMPGRKLWLWAQSRNGGIWEDLLTDTDGQYMEFQAGRTFNQYGPTSFKSPVTQMSFASSQTDRWKDIWFPVKETGGIKAVSPQGILNVSHENGTLRVAVNALAFAPAKLVVKADGKEIYTENKMMAPMEVWKVSVHVPDQVVCDVTVEGMGLEYSPGEQNKLKRPFTRIIPADVAGVSSLYREGMEQKKGRSYEQAWKSLKKCLEKDPLHIDALVALAELSCRGNLYDTTLYYTDQALQLDTYHPAANYYAGITWLAQDDFVNAMEALGWAARSMEYRSVAYAQMAAIQLRLKNADLAEHYADQALDYNRNNYPALKVLAVLYRKQGNREMVGKIMERIRRLDPLNHFAGFEQCLLEPVPGTFSRFSSTITNEFPYQTYLELCLEYVALGMNEEALLVLDKAPEHPLITLWNAYLKKDTTLLLQVVNAPAAFVFPFRTETAAALEWAVSKNNHWKLRYYLGLNYWAIQREKDAIGLFRNCGEEPDYAPFYLTRTFLLRSTDPLLELNDLLKAYQLAPGDWRSSNRLIGYYEKEKDFRQALSVASTAFKKFPENYTIGLQYAKALLNTEQYIACINILEKIHILPFEGSTQGREVYEQAYLAQATKLIEAKKYQKALVMLEKSEKWPENLGVGKPYNPVTSKQDSLKAYCLKKLKTPSSENGNY